MTFDELIDFVQNRMSMSHVYQPLVIRALADADGAATLRQLAVALASQDEAVLHEAEETLNKMPLRILSKHQVIGYDPNTRVARLNTGKLSLEQKAILRALCEQKLGDYLARRGMGIWGTTGSSTTRQCPTTSATKSWLNQTDAALCAAQPPKIDRPTSTTSSPEHAAERPRRRTFRSSALAATAQKATATPATSAHQRRKRSPDAPSAGTT